jgi:hypothetical protein
MPVTPSRPLRVRASLVADTSTRATALAGLALATSLGTLVCCALPAALVAVGAGAVMAGLVTAVPGLVVLSEYKAAVFAAAAVLLALAAVARYLSRSAPCPIDPAQARACRRLRRGGGLMLGISAGIYGVGFFFAYVAPVLQ